MLYHLLHTRAIVSGQEFSNWPWYFVIFAADKCRPAVLPAHTQVRSPQDWKKRRNYGVVFTLSCDYGYTTSSGRGRLVCDPPGWRLEPTSFKCFRKWLATQYLILYVGDVLRVQKLKCFITEVEIEIATNGLLIQCSVKIGGLWWSLKC
jgi:hypothetical protein